MPIVTLVPVSTNDVIPDTAMTQQIAVLQALLESDGRAAELRRTGTTPPGPDERWRQVVQDLRLVRPDQMLASLASDGFVHLDAEATFAGLTTAGRRLAQFGSDW